MRRGGGSMVRWLTGASESEMWKVESEIVERRV